MHKKSDLSKSFKKLKNFLFIYHRGYRGERWNDGILFKGKKYETIEAFGKAVDDLIKEGVFSIESSLNRIKKPSE